MGRVQDYLQKKKIKELGLPKLYIVHSTRKGVKPPVERQVTEIVKGVSHIKQINDEKVNIRIDRYRLETNEYPYEVEIREDMESSKDDSYGSGFGDLWSGTIYSTFSKKKANEFYEIESARVKERYQYSTAEKIIIALDDYGRSVARVEYGLPIDPDTKSFDSEYGEDMKCIVENILKDYGY